MKIKKCSQVPFIIAHMAFFTTACIAETKVPIDNYHISNLYSELEQANSISSLSGKNNHVEKKIKKFTNTMRSVVKNTDPEIYEKLFEHIAQIIGSKPQDLRTLLTDLLTFYDVKNTIINKNTFMLDIVSAMTDYLAEHPSPINFYQLTDHVLQELVNTAEVIKNPTTLKKKQAKKKSRFFKKKYLYYLLSFLSITLTIVIGIKLYKKIKQNRRQAEKLAAQQKQNLENTQKKFTEQIKKLKQKNNKLKTLHQNQLQKTSTIEKRLNTVEHYQTNIEQLERENKTLFTQLKENDQKIKNIEQTSHQTSQQNLSQMQKLDLENKNTLNSIQSNQKKIKKLYKNNAQEITQLKTHLTTFQNHKTRIDTNEKNIEQLEKKHLEKLKNIQNITKILIQDAGTLKDSIEKRENNPGLIKGIFKLINMAVEYLISPESDESSSLQNQSARHSGLSGLVTTPQDAALLNNVQLPTTTPGQ